ncbi:SDR family oxidoreductase [Kitasatospora sp. RB6PN24]|uniref:SDR family oxidoreductase n=1 Tax=Kitasatospora humi TaxID=2893891 RepID=UPI001E65932C|nr:SDR family oxidoreductase [Kitasatospora humi]MCC9312453.1 SDR family oxidoreductase [Kitasatospora humi]
MENPVAVIGGAGSVGRLVVAGLVARGEQVRVVSRRARAAAGGTQAFQADVRDRASLAAPLAGCSAVVFSVEPGTANSGPNSPEATMHSGVRNMLDAATAGGEKPHIVLVSQIYVTRKNHPINATGRMLDWRLAGEDAVRASGLPYTVVRPSWLTGGPGGTAVRLEQGDRGDGQITRQDVADACVEALYSPAAVGKTFEMYNTSGGARADWDVLFANLQPDAVR